MNYSRTNRMNRTNVRRWQIAGVAAVAVALVGVGLGVASAAETTASPTVDCPTVADKIGTVPASAADEVARNLQLLNTQIQNADAEIIAKKGQGGANLIQNAVLGPLKDKRVSTIDRIVIAIGRTGTKPVLDENTLATCVLNTSGGDSTAPEPSVAPSVATTTAASGGSTSTTGDPTVNCPTVADQLGAVPASAAAEIGRNLTLLNTQIQEANARLISSKGQGGVNFIQNAILGPLADKRVATINRMLTAIGRTATKPVLDVDTLATCTLNADGGGNAAPEPTAAPTTASAADAAANAPTVNCPSVALPSIPAEAQAEVDRNVTLLQTQITEADNRLATSVGQGGSAFIQNAILGPLADKRVATLNRIATAIGRHAATPNLNVQANSVCTLNTK
jgi:hypothetical protein